MSPHIACSRSAVHILLFFIVLAEAKACVDLSPDGVVWQQSGFSCRDWVEEGWCDRTGVGPSWRSVWTHPSYFPGEGGIDALTACCGCGGGDKGGRQLQQCEDPSGTDSGGHNCSYYNEHPGHCGCCDTTEFAASQHCCACVADTTVDWQQAFQTWPSKANRLQLPRKGLHGGLSAAFIASLPDLTVIDLSHNMLTGSIPPEIGTLSSLRILHVYFNDLNGTIPPEVGNLAMLTSFDISNCALTGSIPPQMGKLSRLTDLSMMSNLLTGNIPLEIFQLSKLVSFRPAYNWMTGTVPTELGDLTQLEVLDITGLKLAGPIPHEIENILGLRVFNASINKLNGTIPVEFGLLVNLTWLSLGTNQLHGIIPPELCNCLKLKVVDFSQNKMVGTIPTEIGNLVDLRSFRLRGNNFQGEIPPALGNALMLEIFEADQNNLTGIIPESLGNCLHLQVLDFQDNDLTGILPPNFGMLHALRIFYLAHNHVSGIIPPGFGDATHLQLLDFQDNTFSGPIPASLGNCLDLRVLDLADNKLTGTLPLEFGNLRSLTRLSVSENKLTGDVPSTYSNLGSLEELQLSNNSFTGDFPESTWVNLTEFSVRGNYFTSFGELGSLDEETNKVRILDVRENLMSVMPQQWPYKLKKVELVFLDTNRLTSWEPYGCGLSFVRTGAPSCLEKPMVALVWANLQEFTIANNQLNMPVQEFLCSLASLTKMTRMDAGNCSLHGPIDPPWDPEGAYLAHELLWQDYCDNDRRYTKPGFQALFTLNLTRNPLKTITTPVPPALTVADLNYCDLHYVHPQWFMQGETQLLGIEFVGNPALRKELIVLPATAECPPDGALKLTVDPTVYGTEENYSVFECSSFCKGLRSQVRTDIVFSLDQLCRCSSGQGTGQDCDRCPANTYSRQYLDGRRWVRQCRTCPPFSQMQKERHQSTVVSACKCEVGRYLSNTSNVATSAGNAASLDTGEVRHFCKLCEEFPFKTTIAPGSTDPAACVCTEELNGLLQRSDMCGCDDDTYMNYQSRDCEQCQIQEICQWGFDKFKDSLKPPRVKTGFWAEPVPEYTGFGTFMRHTIWRCISKYTCPGDFLCGGNRAGVACGLCAPGYYGSQDGECTACPNDVATSRKFFAYSFAALWLLPLAAHIMLESNEAAPRSSGWLFLLRCLRTSFRQLIKFTQLIAIVGSFYVDWPPLAQSFFNVFSNFCVDIGAWAGIACLAVQQSTLLEIGFRFSLPFQGVVAALGTMVVLAPFSVFCRFCPSRCDGAYRYVKFGFWELMRVTAWGITLFYATLLQFSTTMLTCIPSPHGPYTVSTFPHEPCTVFNGTWALLAGISILYLVCLIVGLPYMIYKAWQEVTKHMVEHKLESRGWWGFFFEDLRDTNLTWVMVSLAKDVLINMIAAAFGGQGIAQLPACAGITAFYGIWCLLEQPFMDNTHTVLEGYNSLAIAAMCIFTAGMGFQSAAGVGDVTQLFQYGAQDPLYLERVNTFFRVQIFCISVPVVILLWQIMRAFKCTNCCLPPCIRKIHDEDWDIWMETFRQVENLDNCVDCVGWMDEVDQENLLRLWQTSAATLGKFPGREGMTSKRLDYLLRLRDAEKHGFSEPDRGEYDDKEAEVIGALVEPQVDDEELAKSDDVEPQGGDEELANSDDETEEIN